MVDRATDPSVSPLTSGSRTGTTLVVLALVACAALPGSSLADVVELTTGERIHGTVKGTTADGIVIEVQGRERTVEQRLVLGVAFEPSDPPAAPPAPDVAVPAAPAPSGPEAAPETTRPSPSLEGAPPAPAPARPGPVLALVSPSPALREAMQALADLRALAVADVSYTDYAARARETRARVDRYLDPDGGPVEIKKPLESAMRLYSFAAAAWNAYAVRGDFAAVGRDPAIAECPRLRQAIEQGAARWNFKADDPAFAGLIAGSEGIADLWECASDRIAEAEKLIAERTR